MFVAKVGSTRINDLSPSLVGPASSTTLWCTLSSVRLNERSTIDAPIRITPVSSISVEEMDQILLKVPSKHSARMIVTVRLFIHITQARHATTASLSTYYEAESQIICN
jgi:hypothetical protein